MICCLCRREFFDKRMNQEVVGDVLGDEFKGYLFKISGGNDKQGFPMKQGIMTTKRVRLLLKKGSSCYRPRRKGERKRKSVRGCIVSSDIQVLNLVIVKKGEGELPGLTDSTLPRRLGPKRASRIRKLFGLNKEKKEGEKKDHTHLEKAYRVKREVSRGDGKKPTIKMPKIQRLVTPQRLQRKRAAKSFKIKCGQRSREDLAAYNKLKAQRAKEAKDRRAEQASKRRSQNSATKSS